MEPHNLTPTPDYVRISAGAFTRNGELLAEIDSADPSGLYRTLGCSYPKFFKMDSLCKWAWLGAEALLRREGGWVYEGLDKRFVAVVLTTTDGCLEVDRRYAQTLADIPSPALFVYTLPNIMLGELCIRHGFTGEQLCTVQEGFDAEELLFQVKDLLLNRGATHCLFGKVDAVDGNYEAGLFWTDAKAVQSISPDSLQRIFAL